MRPPLAFSIGGEFAGLCAVVEVGGVGGDALERGGELGLDEGVAVLVEVAVALEDAAGGRGSWVRLASGACVASSAVRTKPSVARRMAGAMTRREAEFAVVFLA